MTAVEDIIQRILSSGKDVTREKILAAIEDKKVASGGLLTDEAAARLVAAELGVEIEFEKPSPRTQISQLVSGLNDVTVTGRVLAVDPEQTFSRPESEGKVARLLIGDRTGTIKVVLWDEKAELAEGIRLEQIVKVSHGYVRRSRKGGIELHVGQRGEIQTGLPSEKENDFPSLEDFCKKIGSISEVRKGVSIKGTVQTLYPPSTFQRSDGTEGKVRRAVIKDDTGHISVVFWNRRAEEIEGVQEGMTVLLMNVHVRKSRDGQLELHVDDFAGVKVSDRPQENLQIEDLREGMHVTRIEGKMVTKPILREVATRNGEKVLVTSFELQDASGKIWVSAWRNHAKEVQDFLLETRVTLKNVYVRRGFGNQLEIATHDSSQILRKQ